MGKSRQKEQARRRQSQRFSSLESTMILVRHGQFRVNAVFNRTRIDPNSPIRR